MRLQPPDVRDILQNKYLPEVIDVPITAQRLDDGETTDFTRLVDTGGPGRSDRILQTVQITIDHYGASLAEVRDRAYEVDAAMHGLPSTRHPIASVPWATTPQENPDPDVGSFRYTATYQLVVICR